MTSVTLPDTLTRIGASAFQDCWSLTSVTLPDTLTSISQDAFRGCSGITSLTLPSTITSIEDCAFYACVGITSISFPDTLTVIGCGAFTLCTGITSLRLPDNLTRLGMSAFERYRGITAVTLPHKLTTVYAFSFAACAAMQSIAFRPPVSRGAFIAWIVGSSRNRSNWQVTSVKHLRNVLRLITTMAVWSRDVTSLDPDGTGCVLEGCTRLTQNGGGWAWINSQFR